MRDYIVTYVYIDLNGKNVQDDLEVHGVNKQDAIKQVTFVLEKMGTEPVWLCCVEEGGGCVGKG